MNRRETTDAVWACTKNNIGTIQKVRIQKTQEEKDMKILEKYGRHN